MTTISTTTGNQHSPLLVALAAGAALIVGGAIGVAWEQNNDNTSPATHTQATTQESSFGGATTSQEISGSVPVHLAKPNLSSGATTAEEMSGSVTGNLSQTTPPNGATNSLGNNHLQQELIR